MYERIGNNIDYLCNFQMKAGHGNIKRGNTKLFFQAARNKQKAPLTYLAARELMRNVGKGDTVLIVTGVRNDPILLQGESDGPIGAAALARTLDIALGAKTVITVEESNLDVMRQVVKASGVMLRDSRDEFVSQEHAVYVDAFPLGEEAGREYAMKLVETYEPKAIVFTEKHGPNALGVLHTVTGRRIKKEDIANAYFLLDQAERKEILTIGVGDGGNEIGNGVIYEEIRQITDYGSVCVCGCNGGIATVSKTDVFVAASISNWGMYGICAMLALMTNKEWALHGPDTERDMIEACIHNGSVDGTSNRPLLRVDGTSVESGQSFITLLHEIIHNAGL